MSLELKVEDRAGGWQGVHEAMATELRLWIGGVDEPYAKQAAHAFFSAVDSIESKLSLYRENSDVSRINLLDKGDQARISSECVDCLMLAMEASRTTGGRFHPFLGSEALRFKGEIPCFLQERADSAPGQHLHGIVELDAGQGIVRKVGLGGLLDLGGIGKGYALDLAMEELQDWELPEVAASFGGSTLLFSGVDENATWLARLGERPFSLRNGEALASSGAGFQGAHVIDPREGGAALRWQRSFARCASAARADAFSTAALLMSARELEALSERCPPARFAVSSAGGSWGVAELAAAAPAD